MNTLAIRRLREKLADGEAVYGLWVTLDSASVTEMAASLGLDWVVIDAEHGHLDWKEVVDHVRATVRSETVALVRVAELDRGLIKRALDVGADGVVVPWVETEGQLRQAVSFARYPPEGGRGIGAERATGWGECLAEHTSEANDHVLVVPIIETVRGAGEVGAMCGVEGVEIFFLGPADFSASAGFRGQWEGAGVGAQLEAVKEAVLKAGKQCGVVATGTGDLADRFAQGFRVLALGLDGGLLLRSLHESLAAVGRDRKIRSGFRAGDAAGALTRRFARPPEDFRPDRPEVLTPVGSGRVDEAEPGVRFETLVGHFNGARGLTTGLLTLAPSAALSYHAHPFGESITLIEGGAEVSVEGRHRELGPLDNVVIPGGLAHRVRNLSSERSAVFHVAQASDTPTSVPREDSFPLKNSGVEMCSERFNRFRTAARSEAGPGTSFIDYFNATLLPGIEMSGGYGLFQPGGRLPAHVHDFDESICIIEGDATCVVEGRQYILRDSATALQPRGRVHYFVNSSTAPMAMLWVYAGPQPERILVEERCATVEGDPWRDRTAP